ncbi:hypothetical protein HG535_0A06510 [Zygotorulaspora mrakii]|uniref:Mevalonate kinase n=1 Tax=Zygotorulaspora mrakii TaxID=42260 RepID=A0A7H9AY62_ZYGMR|nr:uncharacterized protein HG535_0A06510 [Zygotorulaspora mrakii]QLG70709.1 hypothetical protein HG535_0A06510 [Zygotorulaspora mrakii]
MVLPFLTSAPGKVIIFGEHSAVYNEPAVAASVSALRTYMLVTQTDSNAVELDFPDIGFSHAWSRHEFDHILKDERNTTILQEARHNVRELSPELTSLLDSLHSELKKSMFHHAAFCFTYLYICLCPNVKGIKFSVRSTLPIGAGLGSSASVSVNLAMAMAKLGGLITGTKGLTLQDKKLINDWAFIGEKCMMGTPSGIDNAVSTYGNAVLFKREIDGTTNFEFVEDFPQIPMILTYTKIPRSTKTLVANVRELLSNHPNLVRPILVAMGQLATRGAEILNSLDNGNYNELLELVRVNHGLLVALGVSHPGLEIVRALSDTMELGSTKLTGAGGGGCALTILNKDTSEKLVTEFKSKLEKTHDYATYQTDLGGIGCSLLLNDCISEDKLELILKIFNHNEDKALIDELLLPGKCSLSWIF